MTIRMRAVTQHAFGGPEVLELAEIDRPEPGPGEVLVRVAAAGVNPADWKLRSGATRRLGDPPFTLRFDRSGTVESVGEQVHGLVSGDEVFGLIFQRFGAYADYVVVPADVLAPKPAGLDHVHAAALPAGALTRVAVAGRRRGRATGAGARGGGRRRASRGADPEGARGVRDRHRRAANHDFLRDLGADELIDYAEVDFVEAVPDVDLVFDLIGGAYVPRSLRTLAPTGRLMDAVTPDEEAAVNAAADARYTRVYVRPSAADLKHITELVEDGRLRPVVQRVLPLADVAEAHRLRETGRVRGKLVPMP